MQEMKRRLDAIAQNVDANVRKLYKIELLYRVMEETEKRVDECETCRAHADQLPAVLDMLESALQDPPMRKEYVGQLMVIQKHFHKVHGFINEGYYTSLGISLGLCFGMVFALTIFDNIAFLGLGLPIGLAIGAGMDADAKKKGKVI